MQTSNGLFHGRRRCVSWVLQGLKFLLRATTQITVAAEAIAGPCRHYTGSEVFRLLEGKTRVKNKKKIRK